MRFGLAKKGLFTVAVLFCVFTPRVQAVTDVFSYGDFNPSNPPLSDSEYILQNNVTTPTGAKELYVEQNDVTIRSSSGNLFYLDGGAINQNTYLFNVYYNASTPTSLSLKDIIIRNAPGIYNADRFSAENVRFLNNGTTLNVDIYGGALYNDSGTIGDINAPSTGIVNSVFSGNYLSSTGLARGGAIYNYFGDMSITDTDFYNNTAKQGGAITNWSGNLSLYAINKNMVFQGNTASIEASDIYTRGNSNIYLRAASGKNIIFNGTITGSTTTPKLIAINKPDSTSNNYNGTVLFNDSVSNQRIELYNGILQLGKINNPTPTLGYLNNVVFDFSNSTAGAGLSSYKGVVDAAGGAGTVKVIAGANRVGLYIDADMSNGTSDSYKLNGNSSGLFSLKDVNIVADGTGDKIFGVFLNPNSYTNTIDIDGNFSVFTNTSKYNVEGLGTATPGSIKISYQGAASTDPLNEALQTGATSFSFTSDLVQNDSIARIQSPTKSFTANGNNYTLSTATPITEGFIIDTGYNLNILNLTMKDFRSKDGAAVNSNGSFRIVNSTFENNGGITSSITNLGGAILNKSDEISTISGSSFTGNHSQSNNSITGISGGGAIYSGARTGTAVLSISNSTFNTNSANASGGDTSIAIGGAILNGENSTLNISNSTFSDNFVNATALNRQAIAGGAIYNSSNGTLNVTDSIFRGNRTSHAGSDDAIFSVGGAISNGLINADIGGTVNITNSYFEGNSVGENGVKSYGGAVFNLNDMTITDSSFANNSVTGDDTRRIGGGAIYNEGNLTIKAITTDVVFSGNTVNGAPNDIEHFNGVLTLDAEKNIVLNGGITGNSVTNPIIKKEGRGELVLNGTNNSINGKLELNQGSIRIGEQGAFFNSLQKLTSVDGTKLDFANNTIQSHVLGSTYSPTSGTTQMHADVDPQSQRMDTISSQTLDFATTGKINVNRLNFLSQATIPDFSVNFANDTLKGIVMTDIKTVDISPIYRYYNVSYNDQTGNFNFSAPSGYAGIRPSLLSGAVATQISGYLSQLDLYRQALINMDRTMIMLKSERERLKFANKYASLGGAQTFSPLNSPLEERALWFRPYTTFENVPLDGGPSVSNVGYGGLFGGDSELFKLPMGFEGMFNVFGAYTGAHQTYDGVSIYSNGGALGASAFIYKGNFFTGLTANAGATAGAANSSLGNENFTMFSTGIASKTGYNWMLFNERFIIQPSYMMSYTFVNTFNYSSANGLDIQTKPLNAIQIEPGIKLIGNLKGGLQPYIGISMVWNIIDKTEFRANDVALPDLSVKPFVRYGAGMQKTWGERFTGFAQAFITNGGRNGIGLQFGIRWTI